MAKKSRKQELTERIQQRLKELEDLLLWIPPDDNFDDLFNKYKREAEALVKELNGLK